MEHDEKLFQIEVMPRIVGFWCNLAVYGIYITINIGPILIGLFSWWYLHNWWIGFSLFLFSVLASVIVISKMRINSIPFSQREMDYSTIAVIKWYIGKNICVK